MGNFLKGFGAFFLLTFFILGATGCSEEGSVDPDVSETNSLGIESLPEGFRRVANRKIFGFEVFLEMETLRPAQPPGFEARELTNEDLAAMAAWGYFLATGGPGLENQII